MTTTDTVFNSSILQLSTEVFHLIFDYLDARTILRSFGLVSHEFYQIVNSYDRFKIDCSTFSKSHWESVSQMIQPRNVIAISLSNNYNYMGEFYPINFLFSLFKLDQFTRLKSLKLIEIHGEKFDQLFQHIHKHALKSMSITLCHQTVNEIHRMINFCSLKILPYGLENMDLHLSSSILTNVDDLETVKGVLRCLTINDCTYEQYHRILSSCVNLKTLVIKKFGWEKTSRVLPLFAHINYPQLRSLTIKSNSLQFKELCSVLSLTPSLAFLQITLENLENDCNLNGSDWEEFLRRELIHLKNFQFYFVYNTVHIDYNCSLCSIIKPFKTPFWLNEKNWIVICDFVLRSSDIILYTLPLTNNDGNIVIRCNASSLNDDTHLIATRKSSYFNDLPSERDVRVLFLSLLKVFLNDTKARFLANALEKNTTLITFICDNHSMSMEGICYIANAIAKNETLKEFSLIPERSRSYEPLSLINSRGRKRRRDATNEDILLPSDQFQTTCSTYSTDEFDQENSFDTRGDQDAECIANALTINKTLEGLSLPSNQITHLGAKHLAEALKVNSTLITFSCRCNRIGNGGVDYIADALLINKSLTTLGLSDNLIQSSGIEHLSNVLQMNQTLRTLFLEDNQIDSFGCQYLANMLLNNQTLQELMLGNNSIEDQGAEYLAQALQINTALKTLNLAKNKIRISGAEHLAKALDKNRTIVSLDLESNDDSIDAGILNLIKQLTERNEELLKRRSQ